MGGNKKATPDRKSSGGSLKAKRAKEYKSKEKLPALGEISHISLSSYEEDTLLELFKRLDATRIRIVENSPNEVRQWVASEAVSDIESRSTSSSNESCQEIESPETILDTIDDVVIHSVGCESTPEKHALANPTDKALSADLPVTPPQDAVRSAYKPVHSAERKLMIRQMIRDDRRMSIDSLEGNKCAMKNAKKEYYKTGVLSAAFEQQSLSRRVRICVRDQYSSDSSIATKTYVIERTVSGIADLVISCRRDLCLNSEPGSIILSIEAATLCELTPEWLVGCPDGSSVYVLRKDSVPCVGFIEPTKAPPATDDIPAVISTEGNFTCWTPRCKNMLLSMSMKRDLYSSFTNHDNPILCCRRALPTFRMREEIVNTIRENQVVVIAGDTGSGKSTQLPQYILDDAISLGIGSETFIICTQPRRLSAISLAERVADEISAGSILNSTSNDTSVFESMAVEASDSKFSSAVDVVLPAGTPSRGKELCAYEVRLKSTISQKTRILYCTTGILLRKLQSAEYLRNVSHIILDEVHERQVEMDFLCAVLKARRLDNPHLKLILMSATLDENTIASYYSSPENSCSCPIVRIPGRIYPVQIHYIRELPKFITRWGAVRPSKKVKHVSDNINRVHFPSNTSRSTGGYLSDQVCDSGIAKDTSDAPSPVCDTATVVELMRCIINKHYTERNEEYQFAGVAGMAETKPGQAILVFLSGLQDIRRVDSELRNAEYYSWLPSKNTTLDYVASDEIAPIDLNNDLIRAGIRQQITDSSIQIHILHSSISPEQQRKVFNRTKAGEWKIILSTNIAETSVTIDDVTHVIDTGLVKLVAYDPISHISTLVEQPISIASAKQRSGRAGRTRPGECWRMSGETFWSPPFVNSLSNTLMNEEDIKQKSDFHQIEMAAEKTLPEIRRIPLEEIVLKVLHLGLGAPEGFLQTCMDAPDVLNIRLAVSRLVEMGAINIGIPLTLSPLGSLIAELPMDTLLAKMLIYATMLDCVGLALTVCAFLSGKSPFLVTLHKPDDYYRKYMQFCPKQYPHSDHMAVVNIYAQWKDCLISEGRDSAFQFCRDNFLSYSVLEDISMLRELFLESLIRARLVHSAEHIDHRVNVDKIPLLNYCLCAGLYPNVVRLCRMPVKSAPGVKLTKASGYKTKVHVLQQDGKDVSFHPSSLLQRQVQAILSDQKDVYAVFHKKMASSHSCQDTVTIHLHDSSTIPALALVLFAPNAFISSNRKRVVIDSWIHFTATELHAVMLLRLNTLIKAFIKKFLRSPCADHVLEEQKKVIIDALLALSGTKSRNVWALMKKS